MSHKATIRVINWIVSDGTILHCKRDVWLHNREYVVFKGGTVKHNSHCFSVGTKVEIKIPVSNAKKFSDWAVINEIDGNHVVVQLSRTVLPEGVTIRVGQVIECHVLNDRKGVSYQAIVRSKGVLQELKLDFINEISSDERREFFRVDVFLPVKYHINKAKKSFSIIKQWKVQIKQHKAEEDAYKKKHLEDLAKKQNSTTETSAGTQIQNKMRKSDFVPYDSSWDDVIPMAVNISGGGISLVTNHEFEINELVLLEIFIPSRHRVVDIVSQILFVNRSSSAGDDQQYFYTGMQFIFIDEQDRTAIVHYISQIQSKRLRQMNDLVDMPLYKEPDESQLDKCFSPTEDFSVSKVNKPPIPFNWIGILLVILTFLVSSSSVTFLLRLLPSHSDAANEMEQNIGKKIDNFRNTFQQKQK